MSNTTAFVKKTISDGSIQARGGGGRRRDGSAPPPRGTTGIIACTSYTPAIAGQGMSMRGIIGRGGGHSRTEDGCACLNNGGCRVHVKRSVVLDCRDSLVGAVLTSLRSFACSRPFERNIGNDAFVGAVFPTLVGIYAEQYFVSATLQNDSTRGHPAGNDPGFCNCNSWHGESNTCGLEMILQMHASNPHDESTCCITT